MSQASNIETSTQPTQPTQAQTAQPVRRAYHAPTLQNAGSITHLTQGLMEPRY